MTITNLSTVVIAAVAALTLVVATIAWFYRRGGAEQDLARAVRDNSDATRELTARLERFMARYEERHEVLAGRVNGHDTRLGVAEQRIRTNSIDIARLWPSPGTRHPNGEPAGEEFIQ